MKRTGATALVVAAAVILASTPGFAQPPAAGHAPLPAPDVPQECAAAQAAVPALLDPISATIGASALSAAEANVAAAAADRGEAAGYDAAATGAFLTGHMNVAAWASLEAARRGWNARRAANAGVALIYLNRLADAARFIACARGLDPGLLSAIEAQAMLAHRRHDCATATALIDRLAALSPADMNARYSAGIVHYRCGDRGGAVANLRAAADIAPTDPVVTQALSVVAQGSAPDPVPMPKAVRRQVDEALRFMDEATALADRSKERELAIAMAVIDSAGTRLPIDSAIDLLHRRVDDHKRILAQLEKITSATAARLGPSAWNGVLDQSIRAYFETTQLLHGALTAADHAQEYSVMAAALGMTPLDLADRMRHQPDGDFVVQDAVGDFERATRPVNGVAPPCAVREAAYVVLAQTVQANLKAIVDGFPRAAAGVVTTWMRYESQATDFGHRTARLMIFPATSSTARDFYLANLKQTYISAIRSGVGDRVSIRLKVYQSEVQRMEQDDPITIGGQRPLCGGTPPKAATLSDALDTLLSALQAAGDFDASFESPDCDIEIGGVKVSCKPLAFEGVKATWKGPVDVSVSTDGERWGVDASAGPLSGGTRGSRVDVSSTETSDSAYGVEASVGVSTWIETNAAGQADVYAEATANLGVGVDAEGLGKVSCEFFTASATLNLRAFAEALAR
ncbi:MAG: hypothetical protein ACRD1V_02030 [Vicinamibacterales bacterium]